MNYILLRRLLLLLALVPIQYLRNRDLLLPHQRSAQVSRNLSRGTLIMKQWLHKVWYCSGFGARACIIRSEAFTFAITRARCRLWPLSRTYIVIVLCTNGLLVSWRTISSKILPSVYSRMYRCTIINSTLCIAPSSETPDLPQHNDNGISSTCSPGNHALS